MKTFKSRTFKARTFAARTWRGGDGLTSSVDGWTAQTKTRHFVAASQNRVLITRPQGRIWTARSSNE